MIGDITLEQVDAIYQRMGLKELVVVPWYEDGQLVGLVTGFIEEREEFPGEQSAFLEYFVVLPEAKNKLQVMQLMPATVAEMVRQRGACRVVLCIVRDDPRRSRLERWAKRCGYEKYAENETRDYYKRELTEGDVTNG